VLKSNNLDTKTLDNLKNLCYNKEKKKEVNTMAIRWENLKLGKIVKAPYCYTAEMVAEQYGGNAEDWQIVVLGH
jgi:hypothetical protein